jgi:hypothetical protein
MTKSCPPSTLRRALALIRTLIAGFAWLGLEILLSLLCLCQELFDLLLERVKVALHSFCSPFAALELLHRLRDCQSLARRRRK